MQNFRKFFSNIIKAPQIFACVFVAILITSVFVVFPLFAQQQRARAGSAGVKRAVIRTQPSKRTAVDESRAAQIKVNTVERTAATGVAVPSSSTVETGEPTAFEIASSMRDAYKSQLVTLKGELATLEEDMKASGQCTVDGKKITLAQLEVMVRSGNAAISTDIDLKNALDALESKKSELAVLQKSVAEKRAKVDKNKTGSAVATAAAVAGVGGLATTATDLIMTKVKGGKMAKAADGDDVSDVCGKYGIIGR